MLSEGVGGLIEATVVVTVDDLEPVVPLTFKILCSTQCVFRTGCSDSRDAVAHAMNRVGGSESAEAREW